MIHSTFSKKGVYCLLFTFIIISSLYCAAAESYYADVKIIIHDNGEVEISGTTNHPQLQEQITPDYTSKSKSLWLLNMTLGGVFSDYVFEIHFPKDAVVNYMKIPNILKMEEESGSLVITSTGSDDDFHILAQYSISAGVDSSFNIGIVLLVVLLLLLVAYAMFMRKRRLKTMPKYNPGALTDRQKQIVELVLKKKGSITQAELQKIIGLPKASLSRNIDSLIRKGIITKESKGMTNVISLNSAKKE